MAGATLTTISNILKIAYLPPVREQLNSEVMILDKLDVDQESLVGSQAVVPLHVGRSGGIGARPEGGALPDPGNQQYLQATYDLKYLYGRVRVTGPSMEKSKSQSGAFLKVLESELNGIRVDLRKDTARQFYGDGTASIATCGVTTASATVTLANGNAIAQGQLYVGMFIDIGTAANPTLIAAGRKITATDATNGTITIDGAVVTTSGSHSVSRAGSRAAGVVYEIDAGLQAIVSTSANTIGGLSAASNSVWDNLRDTSGTLSIATLHQAMNRVRIAGGNEDVLIITSFGIQRAIVALLQSQVRYNSPLEYKGGFSSLDWFGKPVLADLEAPFGKIFWVDKSTIKVFAANDWHFLDEDGEVLKWRSGYDEWEAVLARYMNLGAVRRNTNFVQSGITDSTGY